MPIKEYGVWKAKPVSFKYETREDDPKSPHISLRFSDDEPGKGRAAINIKSGDREESRLVCWLSQNFQNPIVDELEKLDIGFHLLEGTDEQRPGGLALDYIRGNLFQKQTGRLLPHDIPGRDNDILDALKPVLDRAILNKATIYLYGSHFNNGKGIHNVHMNQGSPKRFAGDNGVRQDGGFVLQFKDHCEAVFIGFASQAIHTKDSPPRAGYPIPESHYKTWATSLDPEVPHAQRIVDDVADTPVIISQAFVNPRSPDNQTVTLINRTDQAVDLPGWKIRNKVGQFEELPRDATFSATGSMVFEVPHCPLSNQGGLITLLNAEGLKVHGVSYTKTQAKQEGGMVSFDQL